MAEALDLMRTWDYTQKTILTWVKPQIGMGHYSRNNTEHVLFGVRGKLPDVAAQRADSVHRGPHQPLGEAGRVLRDRRACRLDRTWSCSPASSGRAGQLWATQLTDSKLTWS